MAFKVVFLAHAPDAEAEKHRCVIDTGKYKLFVVVVKVKTKQLKCAENLLKKKASTQFYSVQDLPTETSRR